MTNSNASTPHLLAAALDYQQRGWSVIPMRVGADSKRPARKWKRFQAERADEPTIRRWFNDSNVNGVGVVFGDVSGGLISRDFDDRESYRHWASVHAGLAATLPTVETARGRHVYAIAAPSSIEAIRRLIGKPTGKGAINCGDGELRCGVGCYSILPPSFHPSGIRYAWTNEIGEVHIDPLAAGWLPTNLTLHREAQSNTENTEYTACVGQAGAEEAPLAERVDVAIRATLPSGAGERYYRLFHFARRLKAIAELANANDADLESHVREWHRRALPFIATKEWSTTWLDFLAAFRAVKFPFGTEPLAIAFRRAVENGVPDVAAGFEQPALEMLVALCRELQRTALDKPFYLAGREAAEYIKVHHTTIAEWMRSLCRAGILELVEPGVRRKAATYRYKAPL